MNRTISELLEQEEFCKALERCTNAEEALALFSQNGVETTAQELRELVSPPQGADGDGELDEDALETVAGGAGLVPRLIFHWLADLFGWK